MSNERNDFRRISTECPLQSRDNAEILLDYVSRRLAVDETLALERHIEICPACRRFAHSQKAVWNALDAWEAQPVSDDFDRRLRDRIAEEESSGFWARLWRRISAPAQPLSWRPAVAAACGLIIIAGVLLRAPATPERSLRSEAVDLDQVERTLDDMEMLRQLQVATPQKGAPKPL